MALKGTTSGDKNELLFSRFGTNYNEIPQRFRKGTTLFRAQPQAAVLPPPRPSRQSSQQDGTAATSNGKNGDGATPAAGCAPPIDGAGEETSSGQQTDGKTTSLVAAEFNRGACSPVDENPEPASPRRVAQPGVVLARPAAVKDQGIEFSEMSGEGNNAEEAKTAGGESAAVEVVSSSDGKSKSKRLLKKGHAPPGAIEEDACDLIRDHFWDRNPQILAGVARRR